MASRGKPRKFTTNDVGTWLDGALGWHNNYRVLQIAAICGMELDSDTADLVKEYERGNNEGMDPDLVEVAVQEATDYLDTLAPSGYGFYWEAGELILGKLEE